MTRAGVARLGERLAAGFLERRGVVVVGRNLHRAGGEIDLLVRFGSELAAVEVKTRRAGGDDPAEAMTADKLARVRRAGWSHHPPVTRVDLVAVTLGEEGVGIRWIPRIA